MATPYRALAIQAVRFGVVGVSNLLVTLGVIWALRTGLDAPVWLASAAGYGVGMVQGFVLNRFWTFAAVADTGRMDRQAIGFIAVNIVCGLFFTAANVILNRWLPLQVSSVVAAAGTMPLSFALNRWFVFGGKAV